MRTPVSFSTAFATLSNELPQNQTVMDLAYDFKGQMAIIDALQSEKWQQSLLVPLVGAGSNSRISLPFYAGDGVVIKITPKRYETREPMPFVLPHIANQSVSGQYCDYWLTALPMLGRDGITAEDVRDVEGNLAKAGYGFADQDNRPDNLGRLPDGRLCVLDQGAVRSLRNLDAPADATQKWIESVHELYGDVYNGQSVRPQTPETDFSLRPMRAARSVLPDVPSEAPVTQLRHFMRLGRIFGTR